MGDKPTVSEKKPSPPLSGLAIVADLWLWGAILFYAPSYLGIVGTWRILFNVCGFLAITISFVGALLELGKLWKSKGLDYWGASLAFLIPALLLHMAVRYYALVPLLESIARVSTLILAAIGGALLFQGVPYFPGNLPRSRQNSLRWKKPRSRRLPNEGETWK